MTKEEFKDILSDHLAWLENRGGERADLSEMDLRGFDLKEVNLSKAYLNNANLSQLRLDRVNFNQALMSGADLSYVDLRNASLVNADLRNANLELAYLDGVNLKMANLKDANLFGVDLEDVILAESVLINANLSKTILDGVNLSGAFLEGTILESMNYDYAICPTEGSFIGWKKVFVKSKERLHEAIAKLEILEDSKRISCLTSRKCRAEKVRTLALYNLGSQKELSHEIVAENIIKRKVNPVRYRAGEIAVADSFCDDIRKDCSYEIHFFMTRKEAEKF